MERKKSFRELHICVICEEKSSLSPGVICKSCGDFVVHNWKKEAYIV